MRQILIIISILFSFSYTHAEHAESLKPLIIPVVKTTDPSYQYDKGASYNHGQGVEQDYAEAAKWYLKAAKQGHADAQNNLGTLECNLNI